MAGFYTLATGQVDFRDLPTNIVRTLLFELRPSSDLLGAASSRRASGTTHSSHVERQPGAIRSTLVVAGDHPWVESPHLMAAS